MPVDPSIALQGQAIKLPNPLEMAVQGASLRNQTLEGNKLQSAIASNRAMSEALTSTMNPDGTPNIAAANAKFAADPRSGYGAQEAYGTALTQQGQQITNNTDQFKLQKAHYDYLVQQAAGLITKPDLSYDDVKNMISTTGANIGASDAMVRQSVAGIPQTKDPGVMRSWLTGKLMTAQTASDQLSAVTPKVVAHNNNQQTVFYNENPNAGPVAPVPGSVPLQDQVPVTTPVIGGKSGNQKGIYGAHPETAPSSGAPTTPATGGTTNQSSTGTTANSAGATMADQNAIVQTESGGNPNAVSPKGAMGPWQVMPNTMKNPGYGVTPAKDNSPAELERVGHDYYNAMVNKYGNSTLGAIAYNMGPGAMDKWLAAGGQFEKLPQETRNYIGKVSTLSALNSRNSPAAAPAATTAQNSTPANSGFVPTEPDIGVAENVKGNVDTVNNHWAALSDDAAKASTNIGIAQNIKQFAHDAVVGTGQKQLNAMNNILSLLHVGPAENVQTAGQLMEKNMNMLALKSRSGAGGTDAAGALATAALPHAGMNEDAIKDAADQVIGQYHMALDQQKLLQPFKKKNDINGYQDTLTKFNNLADPRVWQFRDMSTQQQNKFLSGMSSADRAKFRSNISGLMDMGVLPK